MYPNVKQCMISDVHLLEVGHVGSVGVVRSRTKATEFSLVFRSCWFISFSPVLRQPSIQSMLKHRSEMEWGHPVGKQLQSHFDFHCFVFVEK